MRALQLFCSMQWQGVVPTVITYSSLITALKHSKQPELAWQVFQAMQLQGMVPDVITYNALILSLIHI